MSFAWARPDVAPEPECAVRERLLCRLEGVGSDAAPRHLGLDQQGREILTFIEGDVPSDCRTTLWRDEQLIAIAELLRRFHDATSGSGVAADAEVVCHNDFGPWNLVWREELPKGIIDYDNAAPGSRVDDLGYAAWKTQADVRKLRSLRRSGARLALAR